MQISKAVLEKNHEKQQKERQEKIERINALVDDFNKWCVEKDLTMENVVSLLQVIDRTFQSAMQQRTLPIIKEWNGKKMRDILEEDKKEETPKT